MAGKYLSLVLLVVVFPFQSGAQETQLILGLDAYSWNKTPSLDSNHTFVSAGNVALNPNVGISFAYDFGYYNYFILNASLNYSVTSVSLGKNRSFGSVNFPLLAGIGFYAGKATYLHLLYGYQFNFVDLYGINKDFSRKDLQFNTHVIELAVGLGDDGYQNGIGAYVRCGFNFDGAFTINTGIRIGTEIN